MSMTQRLTKLGVALAIFGSTLLLGSWALAQDDVPHDYGYCAPGSIALCPYTHCLEFPWLSCDDTEGYPYVPGACVTGTGTCHQTTFNCGDVYDCFSGISVAKGCGCVPFCYDD